jgi:hypothetical protein
MGPSQQELGEKCGLGLGRLTGDIVYERENFRLYLPITTSLLVSLVHSLILWLMRR